MLTRYLWIFCFLQKVLVVGDENFSFSLCLVCNIEQWAAKVGRIEGADSLWRVEVISCLSRESVPQEYHHNLQALEAIAIELDRSNRDGNGRCNQLQSIAIHYSVNPALLRQYFNHYNGSSNCDRPGPPFDLTLCLLPGLSYDGTPEFLPKNSALFQLRIHLYLFALTKSSTVITQPRGHFLLVWPDNTRPEVLEAHAKDQLPFPIVDLHHLAAFCKLRRDPANDFSLNLSWGPYRWLWRPVLHAQELLSVPPFLSHLRVFVIKNESTKKSGPPITNHRGEDGGTSCGGGEGERGPETHLLRIPQSIALYDRKTLPHVNDLFHFTLPIAAGGALLISRLSVKYDPRIVGWRNSGAPQYSSFQAPGGQFRGQMNHPQSPLIAEAEEVPAFGDDSVLSQYLPSNFVAPLGSSTFQRPPLLARRDPYSSQGITRNALIENVAAIV